MVSTGNDIVALKAINVARTKQPNFYKKIISVSEKAMFEQLSDRISLEHFVWLLWSIKESAYKYLQRITPELVFSPTRTVIDRLELPIANAPVKPEGLDFDKDTVCRGTVGFWGDTLYFRSIINEEFVFSVVNGSDDFANIYWGIQLINSSEQGDQSKAVRALLNEKLNILFPDHILQISKSLHGVPVIIRDEIEFPVVVSLAHHDRYVGYSLRIKD